jgi:hypothetical protein
LPVQSLLAGVKPQLGRLDHQGFPARYLKPVQVALLVAAQIFLAYRLAFLSFITI